MIECRILWLELIAGYLVPFAGRVSSFAEAEEEARLRRKTPGCRDVLIEAREHSQEIWPNPLDPNDVWLSSVRVKGATNAR